MLLLERNSKSCVCNTFCHFYHVTLDETKLALPYLTSLARNRQANKQTSIHPSKQQPNQTYPTNQQLSQPIRLTDPKHATMATHEKECSEEEKQRNGEQGKGLTMKEECYILETLNFIFFCLLILSHHTTCSHLPSIT